MREPFACHCSASVPVFFEWRVGGFGQLLGLRGPHARSGWFRACVCMCVFGLLKLLSSGPTYSRWPSLHQCGDRKSVV